MSGLLGWFLAGIVLFLLIGVALIGGVVLFHSASSWKLRRTVHRAEVEIRALARRRVAAADVFTVPGNSAFYIKTETDEQRDLLRNDDSSHREFQQALVRLGYPVSADHIVHFDIESQETVDRDYGGSWHQAFWLVSR